MKDRAIITFSRFQPVTKGHEVVIDKMLWLAQGSPIHLFTSHTKDHKKNPLSYNDKIYFLEKAFPEATIVASDELKNLFQVLRFFNDKVKEVLFVCGSDRVESLSQIKKYKNHPEETKRLTFDLNVIQAGINRVEPLETGVKLLEAHGYPKYMISASLARGFVKIGDFIGFRHCCPTNYGLSDVEELYTLLRKELKC